MKVITIGAVLLLPLAALASPLSPAPCPTLSSATFTQAIENRSPINALTQAPVSTEALFFFTAVNKGNGEQLLHRWYYNGNKVADVQLEVGSAYWRTWSSKRFANLALRPGATVQVSVATASGCELGQWRLQLTAGNAPLPPNPTQPPAHREQVNLSPVDLGVHYAAIEELLSLGDTRGARHAITRARTLTQNPGQLAQLDSLASGNQRFALLNQRIQQQDLAAARQLVNEMMRAVPRLSPLYPALQSRHLLLQQLGGETVSQTPLQAATTH